MRFISRHAQYTVGFQSEFATYLPDGQGGNFKNIVRPEIILRFDPHMSMSPWEMDAAKKFVFTGTLIELDEVTQVTTVNRLSVFDTEAFCRQHNLDDATREAIEQKLLSLPDFGTDYMLVNEPRAVKPWPAYDDIRGGGAKSTAEKVVEQVIALGFTDDPDRLDQVITYERQNLNRGDVIMALRERIVVPAGEPKIELIEA